MVGVPVIDTGPMTVEEFYAFTDARPDEEKWEPDRQGSRS
jgi:hypothetical protein